MSSDEGLPLPTVGVLTVSDRGAANADYDKGGPAVEAYVRERFRGPPVVMRELVPDDREQIASAIRTLAPVCELILTTGGTGPAPRDVTPEATTDACAKMLPGFGERMRMASVDKVPTAILARQTAGLCGTTLVINLPGSLRAIPECMDAVLLAIPHAVRLAGAAIKLELRPEFHRAGAFCKECDVTH